MLCGDFTSVGIGLMMNRLKSGALSPDRWTGMSGGKPRSSNDLKCGPWMLPSPATTARLANHHSSSDGPLHNMQMGTSPMDHIG